MCLRLANKSMIVLNWSKKQWIRFIAAEGSVFYCVYLRDCIIWSFWSKKCHFRLFSIRVPYNLVVYAVGRHQFLTDCIHSLQQSSSYVYLGSHWSQFLIFCFVAFLFYFYPTITFLSNLIKNVIKTWLLDMFTKLVSDHHPDTQHKKPNNVVGLFIMDMRRSENALQ